LLEEYGAVSEPVARAMAEGARNVTGAELAVSVTGVAGPDSDDRGNPVGLVFVGLATEKGTFCRKLDLGRRRRDRIRGVSTNHAFDMIRRYLTGLDPEAM
jgi:nicotinamide-nucleotide amidase